MMFKLDVLFFVYKDKLYGFILSIDDLLKIMMSCVFVYRAKDEYTIAASPVDIRIYLGVCHMQIFSEDTKRECIFPKLNKEACLCIVSPFYTLPLFFEIFVWQVTNLLVLDSDLKLVGN